MPFFWGGVKVKKDGPHCPLLRCFIVVSIIGSADKSSWHTQLSFEIHSVSVRFHRFAALAHHARKHSVLHLLAPPSLRFFNASSLARYSTGSS